MVLSEKVTYDSTTGALVQNSTWSYKPPAAACVPQRLDITILREAPLASGGPIGSKACGEPPLLLSAAALMALQRATQAARSQAAAQLPPAAKPPSAAVTAEAAEAAGAVDAPEAAKEQRIASDGGDSGISGGVSGFRPLLAPATVEAVRAACGPWSAAERLAAAWGPQHGGS
ncbi:hypothetical protein GPECTOR_416g270 [Gonium pectorale]|uniref:Aldehyde oxidase/xanthine dehydrogenase second molybdopterin binding domain-containing protein n=1 Tax=Gonium pectorale TaxID=33097 RepID=A0A150FWV1_GONPE|nr:hypothetical protein GPECTOR_416g270 [Gonium pectorale]|eukprot:KXZ41520.1 hypothetical protein GPECTOR_416g270 [Gonium pectorale]